MKKSLKLLVIFASVMFIGLNVAKANTVCKSDETETEVTGGIRCTYDITPASVTCSVGEYNSTSEKCEYDADITRYRCSTSSVDTDCEVVSFQDGEEASCPSGKHQNDQGEHYINCCKYGCNGGGFLSSDEKTCYVYSQTTTCPSGYSNAKANRWACKDDSHTLSDDHKCSYTGTAGEATCKETTHTIEGDKCYYIITQSTDPDNVAVTGITISPKTKTLDAYESLQMTATITPSNATNKNVTWKSSDTTVAQISSQGEIFALKAGTVTITVTTEDGSITDTATITVNGVLKLKETNYTCSAGSEVGTFVTSSAGLPQFRSSASTIVTIEKHPTLAVDCAGCFAVRINCLTEGTATVYASAGGKESQATVTVVGAETPKKTITIDANGGVIYVDEISTDSYETEEFETTKLSEVLSHITYSREGYTFIGWFTSSTGGDQIDVNNKLKDITVTTIYARWEETSDEPVVDPTLPTATLTYNLNGRGSCSEESKTVNTGDNWGTLCTPTSKGYTFRGWFTGKTSGSEVKSSTEASENITVYAHWTKNKADSNAKTGIYTPIAAILILGVASCIAFIVIRKRKTEL